MLICVDVNRGKKHLIKLMSNVLLSDSLFGSCYFFNSSELILINGLVSLEEKWIRIEFSRVGLPSRRQNCRIICRQVYKSGCYTINSHKSLLTTSVTIITVMRDDEDKGRRTSNMIIGNRFKNFLSLSANKL